MTVKVKPVKVERRCVNALIVTRLETLAVKQQDLMPVRKPRSGYSAAAEGRKALLAEAEAKYETRRKKEPLSTQARGLVEKICVGACFRKRPSMKAELPLVRVRQAVEEGAGIAPTLPPRTRLTGPCLRGLDRAEARLLKLVTAWALTQARKEADASA